MLLTLLSTTRNLIYYFFIELSNIWVHLVGELSGHDLTFALFVRAHFFLICSLFKAYFAKHSKANVSIKAALHRLINQILTNKAIVVVIIKLDTLENFMD